MKIYITGSNGFLAQKFCEVVLDRKLPYDVYGVSKAKNRNIYLKDTCFRAIDLTDFDLLAQSLAEVKPTHLLHTAAMTTVEGCELHQEEAYKINVLLTAYLADYCAVHGIHLTFLSTDFVFDGKAGPYAEIDATHPLNYYGETKVLAEQSILGTKATAAILRTILVYGAIPDRSRGNLVLLAKSQLEQNMEIKVVVDQWRMPTWVDDLAVACILAMEARAVGIFHISGNQMMTIYEAVVCVADTLNLDKRLITSIEAKDLGQADNRPRKTGFNLLKSKNELSFVPTSFVESLPYICEQLKRYGR